MLLLLFLGIRSHLPGADLRRRAPIGGSAATQQGRGGQGRIQRRSARALPSRPGAEAGPTGSNRRWCGEREPGLLEEPRGRGPGGALGSPVPGPLLAPSGTRRLVGAQ